MDRRIGMNQIKNILYLGWLGKGNVGDDVLFEIFKRLFYENYMPKVKNVAVNIDAYPIINKYKIDLATYDLIVLGGGSLLHLPFWLRICKEGMEIGIPVVSWGTGIDGPYRADDVDHTISHTLRPFKGIYDRFDYLSVRGNITKQILTNVGVSREIEVIGDPALSYMPDPTIETNSDKNNTRNILINWGTVYNQIFGRSELTLENELVSTIEKLIQKGYHITIYPIWTEDIHAVQRLAKRVNHVECSVYTTVYEAKILNEMIQQSYLSINLKLHGNVLSAAANTPFISLAYRGKCFDFSDSVQCNDYTVATDIVTEEGLLSLVGGIERNYKETVHRLLLAKEQYYPKWIHSIQMIISFL